MKLMVFGTQQVKNNIAKLNSSQRESFYDAFDQWAALAENYSKSKAPWTDRTGNARNSIYGRAPRDESQPRAYHGIGVYYGVFLELANQGRYRVIWPTMESLKGRLTSLIKRI